MTPEEFVRLMRDATGTIGLQTKLGKVASGYSSGRPTIVFDAETVASTRTYPYLGSYTPAANDRVLLIGAGNTWVVLGKIV